MSLDELCGAAWQSWFDDMIDGQGLGYLRGIEEDLRSAFEAGWHEAPLRVVSVKLDRDSE